MISFGSLSVPGHGNFMIGSNHYFIKVRDTLFLLLRQILIIIRISDKFLHLFCQLPEISYIIISSHYLTCHINHYRQHITFMIGYRRRRRCLFFFQRNFFFRNPQQFIMDIKPVEACRSIPGESGNNLKTKLLSCFHLRKIIRACHCRLITCTYIIKINASTCRKVVIGCSQYPELIASVSTARTKNSLHIPIILHLFRHSKRHFHRITLRWPRKLLGRSRNYQQTHCK